MKKFSILLIVALLAVAALAACTPETVVETVIVEVEGETIIETVVVEVEVEVPVEVEVEKEVEVPVEVDTGELVFTDDALIFQGKIKQWYFPKKRISSYTTNSKYFEFKIRELPFFQI